MAAMVGPVDTIHLLEEPVRTADPTAAVPTAVPPTSCTSQPWLFYLWPHLFLILSFMLNLKK